MDFKTAWEQMCSYKPKGYLSLSCEVVRYNCDLFRPELEYIISDHDFPDCFTGKTLEIVLANWMAAQRTDISSQLSLVTTGGLI